MHYPYFLAQANGLAMVGAKGPPKAAETPNSATPARSAGGGPKKNIKKISWQRF